MKGKHKKQEAGSDLATTGHTEVPLLHTSVASLHAESLEKEEVKETNVGTPDKTMSLPESSKVSGSATS